MRIRWTDLLLVAALAVAVPGAAVAEDENLRREMDEMRNMILQLQDTVQAQSGQIQQQRQVSPSATARPRASPRSSRTSRSTAG